MTNAREKLIELLGYETCKDKVCIGCKHYSDEAGCVDYLKAEIADHMIANDVVSVVRCKDCDFCHYNSCNDTYRCSTHNGMNRTVEPDDFCSYGERREGE